MNTSANSFSKLNYFPTMIFQINVGDADTLNTSLLNSIYSEQKKDQDGINRSNYKELGGWHSNNNLHKTDEFSNLVEHIKTAGERISTELGYSQDHSLKIGTMWSIINPPGSANRAHIHPGCLWSGVYYVHAPKNAGNIEFIEPRTAHMMTQAKFAPNKRRPKDCWTKVNFTPVAGKMIIFPSWLYHGVNPNQSEEEGKKAHRVIISFNLSQHNNR